MSTTLVHWTLHPWAIYAVVGLGIAYSCYRRRRRQTISAVFVPLFGERHASGGAGRIIDVLAIFATLFGSATSLGLGALQIGSGVEEAGWMKEVGTGILVVVIAVLTANGVPDESFAQGGFELYDMGGTDTFSAAKVAPNEQYVAIVGTGGGETSIHDDDGVLYLMPIE